MHSTRGKLQRLDKDSRTVDWFRKTAPPSVGSVHQLKPCKQSIGYFQPRRSGSLVRPAKWPRCGKLYIICGSVKLSGGLRQIHEGLARFQTPTQDQCKFTHVHREQRTKCYRRTCFFSRRGNTLSSSGPRSLAHSHRLQRLPLLWL